MEETTKLYSLSPPGFMCRGVQSTNTNNKPDINDMPIGMAYVPRQKWQDIYEKDKAIMRGTLFAELDKPFKGAMR